MDLYERDRGLTGLSEKSPSRDRASLDGKCEEPFFERRTARDEVPGADKQQTRPVTRRELGLTSRIEFVGGRDMSAPWAFEDGGGLRCGCVVVWWVEGRAKRIFSFLQKIRLHHAN